MVASVGKIAWPSQGASYYERAWMASHTRDGTADHPGPGLSGAVRPVGHPGDRRLPATGPPSPAQGTGLCEHR